MRIALDDLKLDHLFVVYPGTVSFPMEQKVEAVGITDLPAKLARLG